jgi:hypothetical protein
MTPPLHTGTRRRLLATTGSLTALAIAGCLDGDDSNTENESAETDDSDDSDGDDGVDDDIDDEDFDLGIEDEPQHGQGGHAVDIAELLVYDGDGEQVANSHAGHWHYETEISALPTIEEESTAEFEAVFTKDGDELSLGEDERYQLEVVVADGADEALVDLDVEPSTVSISGTEAGQTAVVFQLAEADDVVWEAPEIETIIEA